MLPEDLKDELPSSFTHVGHIAHMNLREQYLPYKYLIGRVLIDVRP
jgi:tRNA (guanine37-N1)-methyltransferase